MLIDVERQEAMKYMDNKQKALALSGLGIHVFPVKVQVKPDNPFRTTKRPLTENGFKDATTDPKQIQQWWAEFPDAHVGVWAGKSGLHFVDLDVKRSADGTIEVDGLENLVEEFMDLPETFKYDSVSGAGGEQYVYAAPEGSECGPDQDYRGIKGVDIRAGGSYSVWVGDVPQSRDVFKPAPEWVLDVKKPREADPFSGTVQDWFDSLEPGSPSVAVRNTMERVEKAFSDGGNDLTHQQIIEFQHNAIRLGSEGHTGVQALLDLIRDKTVERTGEHSRTPDDYEHEFHEALVSGIEKHGAITELRASMPAYSLDLIPLGFPGRFIDGSTRGDKTTFSEVLRLLTEQIQDDATVLSVLWNLPATRDLARDWGLQFVHERIVKGRKNPEPVGENPSLEIASMDTSYVALLTAEEKAFVKEHPTFIDRYLEVSADKGYCHEKYSIPAAWSLLSAGLGDKAWTPTDSGYLGLNLWFTILGPSGSGKSVEHTFVHSCMRLMLEGGETSWEIGASSSPEGLTEALLLRDGKTSVMIPDEAADFYETLTGRDYMKGMMQKMSKLYDGFVPPENKIRMKDLKGKSAQTSFNFYASSTPAKLLPFVTSSMFESGFLARMLWSWDESVMGYDESRFMLNKPKKSENGINPGAYELAKELLAARGALPDHTVELDWDDEVADWLFEVNKKIDSVIRTRLDDQAKYESFGRPSAVRLAEVMLKCAGLLALWRGETFIRKVDIMTAAYYAEDWFNDLFKVVREAGKSDFLQGADEIETFIGDRKGVSRAQILTRFGHLINRGGNKDVDMRIDYLVDSGKIRRDEKLKYWVNGKREEKVDV